MEKTVYFQLPLLDIHACSQVIAITVENEDISKFKEYTPSAPDASTAADSGPSVSTPPQKEVAKEPVTSPEPKVSKPSETSAEDRVFASPLARNLAEENKV